MYVNGEFKIVSHLTVMEILSCVRTARPRDLEREIVRHGEMKSVLRRGGGTLGHTSKAGVR